MEIDEPRKQEDHMEIDEPTKDGQTSSGTPKQHRIALKLYPPIETITSPNVETGAAAHYLNRKQQTLRIWALGGHRSGPVKPLRVNGRLAWPVDQLKKVLGVAK